MARPRAWLWLQLTIGWLPIWALFTTLIATAHPDVGFRSAIFRGFHAIAIAALLGLLVNRVTERLLWPHPFRLSFFAVHALAAALYAALWVLLTVALDALLFHGRGVIVAHYLLAGYSCLASGST